MKNKRSGWLTLYVDDPFYYFNLQITNYGMENYQANILAIVFGIPAICRALTTDLKTAPNQLNKH